MPGDMIGVVRSHKEREHVVHDFRFPDRGNYCTIAAPHSGNRGDDASRPVDPILAWSVTDHETWWPQTRTDRAILHRRHGPSLSPTGPGAPNMSAARARKPHMLFLRLSRRHCVCLG